MRGGRFVGGFPGEQFALPAAIEQLREGRRRGVGAPLSVGASDPLNLQGILTPAERVPSQARRSVQVVCIDSQIATTDPGLSLRERCRSRARSNLS